MLIVPIAIGMPNHIHLLWELIEKKGKEMPHASFNKKTAHEILKDLKLIIKKYCPFLKLMKRNVNIEYGNGML